MPTTTRKTINPHAQYFKTHFQKKNTRKSGKSSLVRQHLLELRQNRKTEEHAAIQSRLLRYNCIAAAEIQNLHSVVQP